MLYIIGIGLEDENDLTLKTIKILKNSDYIFLEQYTSINKLNLISLENIIGKKIEIADRIFTESSNSIFQLSKEKNVSFLVVGTPMFATTHFEIILQAKENKIDFKLIHNASIMNVMGCYGLFSYNFGRTISIPFYEDNWRPTSFYDYFIKNKQLGLHTLSLLDIRVKEVKKESLFLKEKVFEEPRFMNPNQALEQLYECDKYNIFNDTYKIIVISRFGKTDEGVFYDTLAKLKSINFGDPLHSLILPGDLEILEKENLESYFSKK